MASTANASPTATFYSFYNTDSTTPFEYTNPWTSTSDGTSFPWLKNGPSQEEVLLRALLNRLDARKTEAKPRFISRAGRRFKIVAVVAGTLARFAGAEHLPPLEYTAESLRSAKLNQEALLNINHEQQAVIGRIVSMETFPNGDLALEFELDEKFDYLADVIQSNRHDGVSIESHLISGYFDEKRNRIIPYEIEVTGLALVLAAQPACPKEVCTLLSTAFPGKMPFKTEAPVESTVKGDNLTDKADCGCPGSARSADVKSGEKNMTPTQEAQSTAAPAPVVNTDTGATPAPAPASATEAAPSAPAPEAPVVAPPAQAPAQAPAQVTSEVKAVDYSKQMEALYIQMESLKTEVGKLMAHSTKLKEEKLAAESRAKELDGQLVISTKLLDDYKAVVLESHKDEITERSIKVAAPFVSTKATKPAELSAKEALDVLRFVSTLNQLDSTTGPGAVETERKAPAAVVEKKPEIHPQVAASKLAGLIKAAETKKASRGK